MIVFGQKWLYSGKVVEFGQKYLYLCTSGCNREKTGCIRAKWLYSGKVVVFEQKWLYSSKVDVLGQK